MAGDLRQVTAADLQQASKSSTLDLANRQLTVLPPEVVQLTNLQALLLFRNQLLVLPSEVGRLARRRGH